MKGLNQDRLKVIMGGSQSTGSSLLVNILNRHSRIVAGPETYLFMHPKLYHNWKENKKYLIRTNKFFGLKSMTWFKFNGAKLIYDFYGWKEKELKQMILASTSFTDFVEQYMAQVLEKNNGEIWIEKSPPNTVSFLDFLNCFSSSKVVHTSRNPYDVVASIVSKGYSYYEAAGSYITDTALALRIHNQNNYHFVKYEDLVLYPEKTVNALLNFMGLEMEPLMLHPSDDEKALNVKMKGWKNNEKGTIQKSSLNRFEQEDEETKERIKAALFAFEINSTYAQNHQIKYRNIEQITELLGYEILVPQKIHKRNLRVEKLKDQFKRFVKLYPAFSSNYPGGLRF